LFFIFVSKVQIVLEFICETIKRENLQWGRFLHWGLAPQNASISFSKGWSSVGRRRSC
jgi:hypothetical protein